MSADHHGNTPAAWTGVALAMIGFVVGSVGLMQSPVNMTIFWIGIALLPISVVVWQVMERLGMGNARH